MLLRLSLPDLHEPRPQRDNRVSDDKYAAADKEDDSTGLMSVPNTVQLVLRKVGD